MKIRRIVNELTKNFLFLRFLLMHVVSFVSKTWFAQPFPLKDSDSTLQPLDVSQISIPGLSEI